MHKTQSVFSIISKLSSKEAALLLTKRGELVFRVINTQQSLVYGIHLEKVQSKYKEQLHTGHNYNITRGLHMTKLKRGWMFYPGCLSSLFLTNRKPLWLFYVTKEPSPLFWVNFFRRWSNPGNHCFSPSGWAMCLVQTQCIKTKNCWIISWIIFIIQLFKLNGEKAWNCKICVSSNKMCQLYVTELNWNQILAGSTMALISPSTKVGFDLLIRSQYKVFSSMKASRARKWKCRKFQE